jgi:CRP-like cAMP-binding protein
MEINDPKHSAFLQEIPLFKALDEHQLKAVVKHLYTKEVSRDEIIFSRLEKEHVLYIVRYGELHLELVGGEDMKFEKGDIFGEVAFLNNNLRTGTVKAREASLLFCLNSEDLLDPTRIPADAALKIVLELARKLSSYLESAQNISTRRLIELGENEFVEFKSSLRYNFHTKKYGKEIEHAVLKTIAAFLNTSGGTLIIGVDDDKNIIGIGQDRFQDSDHVLLHLTRILQERIGTEHARFVKGTLEQSNGKEVLRVDVKPAPSPAYLTYNSEEVFYVRTGPATTPMRVSEVYNYILSRFYGNK